MKKISIILTATLLLLGVSISSAKTPQTETQKDKNIQIFSVDNAKGDITAKSIEKAFNDSGLVVDVNNNMNSIFEKKI